MVQHLLAGHGPLFNLGERVEAYTNPLWVAVLALWGALGGPLEPGALLLGLAAALGGLVAAQLGAARLARRLHEGDGGPGAGLIVPCGAVVLAVLPPVWDFATSGLETGLTFGWLGLSYLLLVGRVLGTDGRRAASPGRLHLAALAIGLGPLVRPDLAIFAVVFLAALLVPSAGSPGAAARSLAAVRWGVLGTALAVPVAYQVFRMGYFAALTANPAMAKEAAQAAWLRGVAYAGDFALPYALPVPLALALGWLGPRLARAWARDDRAALVAAGAPALGAALHALYVIRVGGDFMHARLLLPSLFAALLPVATVVGPRATRAFRPPAEALRYLAPLLLWAVVCAAVLRISYPGQIAPSGIADERGFYARVTGSANPVRLRDHLAGFQARHGDAWTAGSPGAASGRELVLTGRPRCEPATRWGQPIRRCVFSPFLPGPVRLPLSAAVSPEVSRVLTGAYIGAAGSAIGLDGMLVDQHGVSDPLAARLELAVRGLRAGHEKLLPTEWVVARFSTALPPDVDAAGVAAARRALACPPLQELLGAVSDPMTPARFAANLRRAVALQWLRIPEDPARAERALCASGAR